jgi:predicted nucleic acid-binding protein
MNYSIPHYLDTSVAVKMVTHEIGSDLIQEYMKKNSSYHFHITEFVFYEVLSVLKQKWCRKEITIDQYQNSVFKLDCFLHDESLLIDSEYKPDHLNIFVELKEFVTKYKLDYSDALQLFTVLHGKWRSSCHKCRTIFVTADKALANASKLEGLRTWHFLKEPPPTIDL